MADRFRSTVAAATIPAALIAAWQVLASAGVLDFSYLPTPTDILTSLTIEIRSGALAEAVLHTVSTAATASVLALVVGTGFGVTLGLFPVVRRWVEASVEVLRTVPALMLIPVAVLSFGPSAGTVVALAGYAALWPMVLNTSGAVSSVHPRQFDVARTLRLDSFATIRKIVLPAAAPVWLVGARMSAVLALLVAIVVEMVMGSQGVGGAMIQSLHGLDPARMWAYAFVSGLIGLLVNVAMRAVYRAASPGHPASTPTAPVSHARVASPRGLAPVAVILAAWQLCAPPDSLALPPPAQWLSALTDLIADGSLLPAVGQTLATYLSGLAVGTVVGAALGAVIGASPAAYRALSPTLDFLAAIPGAAVVPVLVLLLGPNLSGIAAVAAIVTWPILLSTVTARRTIPTVRLEMARTLGLTPVRRWRRVVIPSMKPGIVLGVRVASSLALIIALLADIFGSGSGIGRLLIISQQQFDAAAAWGLLLIVGAIGYLSNAGLAMATRVSYVPDRQVASAG